MSRPLPILRPIFSYFLGFVPQGMYESPQLVALLHQRGVDGIRLSYSLNAPSVNPEIPTLLGVQAYADTQEGLDQWLPTIKTVIQPFLDNRLLC